MTTTKNMREWKKFQRFHNWENQNSHVRHYYALKDHMDYYWIEQFSHIYAYIDSQAMKADGC